MALLKVYADTKGSAKCRSESCQVSITWYELTSGKRMPFDGDPVFITTEYDGDHRLIGTIDSSIDKSHFATCPDAQKWRKKA